MFIRDGVLTASGKRMCRILKGDPNALTSPQTEQKTRRKPGPKPKNAVVKTMRNIRILLPKIPDMEQKEEGTKRTLRSATRQSYAESDDDEVDNKSVATETESLPEVESESESSDEERDKSLQNADPTNKTKAVKRKRGKGWASGNIPSSKKKKKKQSLTEEAPATPDSVTPTEMDRSFIEPDKDYYIDFGWKKGHQCRLCDYHGKYITTHYKTEHSGSEILTSRFSPAVAKEAIEDSNKNLSRYESLVRKQGSGKIHFTCRFCAFNTTVPPTVFYDHITTHTGEYRHMCPMCDFSASSGKTLKSHMSSIHNDVSKRVARKTYSDTILFAYLCGECNYVQLSRQSVEEHVNIFHLQKPKIYKVNMSTVVDPEVGSVSDVDSKKEPVAKDETPSPKENVKAMLAPPVKKRMKPGPKCMKDRLKALEEKEESVSNTSTTESDVSVSSNAEVEAASPQSAPKAVAASRKRLVKEVSVPSEEDSTVVGGRSRRAAKDKATEKLKTLMEVSENSTRKKPVVVQPEPEDEGKKDVAPNAQAEQPVQEKKHRPGPKCKTEKKVEVTNIKKEVEMNVFTCKTDIQEENKKIEQERLQLMDELNKSVGSRTTLNFVDKLCNRLSNNDIMVKQEPRDEPVEVVLAPTPVPSVETDTAMPVLEENLPTKAAEVVAPPQQAKKPVLETEDIQVSNPSFDVTQKKDKIITDMIQKLKGKLADDQCQSPVEAETPPEADYDSEGPPPLTHVHELPNVKPADGSTKTLLIGGLVKVIKYSNSLMFSCLVPPCVFSTDNRDAFQKHCSEAHKQLESCTLCEICGMEITSTNECTLLESIFQHAFRQHSDFMNATPAPETPKPSTPVLRIRKLSGDALSIKKDWEDETDDASPVGSQKEDQEDGAAPSQAVAAPSTAVVDLSDDNPFPFKISGVMSLAESVPPLTPLVKSAPAPAPTPSPVQLIVKEAKLNNTELTKSRKTPKAMAKFISSVSDLYKCPHYYCLFSTNFRDFLERHLRAHKMEPELMIPCVYCDMKTPWEHVAMHIDIRHAHCRFACSYCLYRAVVKEYVFLHQDQMHPENDYSVIALPQPKNSKRWAIAEAKIEPKTLCDPYKCTPSCGVEFLFENEFRRHLNMKHKSNFIPCGYQNCLHRVQANKMPNHWGLNHSISVYQCGLCTANHNDIKKLYHHFATSHQGCQPNILIRINAEMEDSITLGYTAEAFNHLRRVVSIPSNVCENKTEAAPAETSTPIVLPNPVPYSLPSKTTLQIVPPLQQNPAQKSVLIPTSKSVLNHSITFVSTNSSTPGTGNIVFVPAVTNAFTGGIMVQQPSTSSSDKASDKTVNVVPSVPTVTTPTVLEIESAPVEDAPPVKDLAIEHVTVGDDAVQAVAAGDEAEAEVDPLSLDDADAFKSVADSSDDEADAAKTDKTKKCTKSGLLSYQLYRCAFCDISFSNSVDFKRHATYSATCREDAFNVKPFTCVHCAKQLKTPHMLVEHIQCHGILRFACSLCGNKFPNLSQTRSHMKIRHNITHTSVTPLNAAKQNPDTDEYVLRPKLNLQIVAVKEASAPESSASTAATEDVYTPDTIDKIPMRHILSSSARCGLCSYTTKVRTNMVRHLQFHSEEKAVPDTAPVNPVPCLEKNEKMFDKMVNLASSSHTGSRMGGGGKDPKEKETETFPEFVPSHCRYVCCAHNCSYMCPEEGNLRHHLIALHDGETSFTCVHCKTDLTPTDADSLLKHFKLHALQLYKCHYCSFIHNLKHKVEKHANDSHLDAPLKVITLRCMETEPKDAQEASTASNSQATPSTTTTGKIYKPWRCCMCKYKSGTLDGIQHHVLEKHEFDSQFKCALCSYKTDDTDTFTEHFKESHDNQAMDIIYAYRKLEEDNKEKEKEPEAFDTTPLWQRDRPRVRHIRGILFDESVPATKSPKKVKTAPAPSPGPSVSRSAAPSPGPSGVKSAAPSPGPSGVKNAVASPGSSGVRSVALPPGTSLLKTSTHAPTALDMCIESVVNGTADILREASSNISDDFFLTINKMMKDSNEDIAKVKDSMVIVIEDEEDHKTPTVKDKDNKNAPTAKNRPAKRKGVEVAGFGGKMQKVVDEVIDLESGVGNDDADQDEFGERSLKVQFGPMGVPQYRQYKCPVCAMFKSKRICDFVFHLFKEMKIFRFKCKVCSDESITYRYMYKHIRANHPNSDHKQNIIRLPPNLKLLTWLQMVLREQSIHITKSYPKIHVCAPPTFPNPVKCDFCEDKFKWEQDKNEHSVEHWMSKPFGCCLCGYTAYVKSDVETHFKAEHQDRVWIADENVTMKGPTVEKLLQISDDLHLREITERLEKEKGSLPAPPSKVEERVPQSLFCAESMSKEDDGALSDSDLIIVTKTDRDVPTESDVFCCEYCAYMGDSEMHVISHITAQHEYMAINFKKLNQVTCNVPKEYVGCMICSTVGSEVMVRRHHMEKHAGLGFSVYRFECLICPQKRFLKFAGLKVHFNKVHTGLPLNYGTVCGEPEEDKGSKTYRCPLCPYVRNFRPTALNNMRAHLKQHFKAFMCGICLSNKYKTRADVITHYVKEHPLIQDQQVVQDLQLLESYNQTMNSIIASATDVAAVAPKNTARKSTSAPHPKSSELTEYSFYGNRPEQVDLSKIKTSVEINGMHLDMSAEKLSKIFDLDVAVALEDCNLCLNMSNLFDS
ncbi:hypothetical protein NQ315_000164 [Exocentrus adspersus]|uniref:C2H2-type domain-containing protein n=1 Tax=Exocentrus adspersus TaxID=1586481 RepID=A0AAV8VR78_9CUCU|nr:hypothetical protein NQ315_000164 [Exocentrus adspersus]